MTNDDSGDLISFKWNNHQTTFFEVLADLRAKDIYTDVTLSCEHQFISAHKLVLSTCSDYFKEIFARAACISPVIILKDIRITELDALIDYMYLGEADVKESDVDGVLRAAECLKIRGLGVPDEYSEYFSSTTSSVEAELPSPNKKIKLEDKNTAVKSEPQHKNKQLLPPPVKEEKKRKGTQDNFPLLINALKAATVARRPSNSIKFTKPQFRNHALKNKNSTHVKSNREIKVIGLPSYGKKVDLMTVKMNEEVSEYNKSKQLSTDSTIHHCSNSLSTPHEENKSNIIYPVLVEENSDSVSDCHTLPSQINTALPQNEDNNILEDSANSSWEINAKSSYSQSNVINMQQRELYDVSTEAIDMEMSDGQNAVKQNALEVDPKYYTFSIFCEAMRNIIKLRHPKAMSEDREELLYLLKSEWYDLKKHELKAWENHSKYILNVMEEDKSGNLKLPKFSPLVQPYLNGDTVSHKKRCHLRSCIVDQLIKHFSNIEELRNIPNFYSGLENLLIQTYPNIVEDKCKKRPGPLGSLISLMRSESKKATKDVYKFNE